jgi:nicotinamide mononucleotide transporter
MSSLEIVAVIVSFLAIWLTTSRHMLCWPVGLLSVLLYGKVFFDAKLYSDTLLQGFFGVFQLYGWILWRRGQEAAGTVQIAPFSIRDLMIGLIAGALGTAVLGSLMSYYTDAAVPWLDATLTGYSLVGQYWVARRFIANWILWIVVDVIYTGLYVFKGLNLTAGLYAAFVVLAILGWRRWQDAVPDRRA